MKWKNVLLAINFLILTMEAGACVDLMSVYSVGVVFSKGEAVFTEKIEAYTDDTLSYIKECEVTAGDAGQPIRTGTVEGKPSDPLTIDSAWVSMNTLYLTVSYGGGCKVHTIEMYTDGKTTATIPGMIHLNLTHEANDDNCKAIKRETIAFNLYGLCECSGIELNIFEPGSQRSYSPSPVWNAASGAKINLCSYKIRSGFSDGAMVYIGKYTGISDTGTNTFRQLLVVLDSAKGVPSTAVKAAALNAEIERLVEMGVLSVSAELRNHLVTKLTTMEGQYWTAEDSVLEFNKWFGGSGVNGVKGVWATRGCGSGVAYEVPLKPLGSVAVTSEGRATPVQQALKVEYCRGKSFVTFGPLRKQSRLILTNLSGRTVYECTVPAGRSGITLDNSNKSLRGCFLVAIIENGHVLSSAAMSILQ